MRHPDPKKKKTAPPKRKPKKKVYEGTKYASKGGKKKS